MRENSGKATNKKPGHLNSLFQLSGGWSAAMIEVVWYLVEVERTPRLNQYVECSMPLSRSATSAKGRDFQDEKI